MGRAHWGESVEKGQNWTNGSVTFMDCARLIVFSFNYFSDIFHFYI